MHLKSFRITNYRSVNDSGEVTTNRITAILGRNESGKSNLLRALASLNPPGGIKPLSNIKDFPRHRRLQECEDGTPVVSTLWDLTPDEQAELAAILPAAVGVTTVRIGRGYGGKHTVVLDGYKRARPDASDIHAKLRKAKPHLLTDAGGAGEHAEALKTAAEIWERTSTVGDLAAWPDAALGAATALRGAFSAAGRDLPDLAEPVVGTLEELAATLKALPGAETAARKWAVSKLPTFIFLDEFPELRGHQDIADYLQRRAEGRQAEAEFNFERLCKVAGLDPQELQQLQQANDHESRNQLVNRASAVITGEVRRLWNDRPLKIRFNIDAQHLDTLISDPNETYDVEVNLDERSRGFRWFFSFYVALAADTSGGNAENAVLLLDEPGLFLHALSQGDLLKHFDNDFKNQIIYTTHSPFMVPTHALDRVRTASITKDEGTTVSNDPTGDSRTLFPLQSALGYSIAQSLFVGGHNLVVEGVTDFWIISAAAAFIAEKKGTTLDPRLTVTPAGGAQKVNYMVALLTSEDLRVLVLLDDEPKARDTKRDLLTAKLVREDAVAFVSAAFVGAPPSESDIEDLLDPDVFEALIREAYAKELKGKKLAVNSSIPRISKRFEAAFDELGIPFHKTRHAKLLLQKMGGATAEDVMTATTVARFEALFTVLNAKFSKLLARDAPPFS